MVAGAGRSRREAPRLPTHRQRDQEQWVEPDDVEVEPVVHGQLERDQQGRAQGRDLDQGLASCGRKARSRDEGAGRRPGSRCAGAQASDLAPDAERGVAARLVGDRAVVDGVQARVDRGPRQEDERAVRARGRPASESLAPRACSAADPAGGVGQQHRDQHRRGELREGGQGGQRAPRERAGEDEQGRRPAASPPGSRWSSTRRAKAV